MIVSVEDNPNCAGCGVMRFEVRSLPRRVSRVVYHAAEGLCDVTGWGPGGAEPALAQKVLDSGDGVAWLVRGGEWGLRLKPADDAAPWGLKADGQWGEPFLLVSGTDDMTFG